MNEHDDEEREIDLEKDDVEILIEYLRLDIQKLYNIMSNFENNINNAYRIILHDLEEKAKELNESQLDNMKRLNNMINECKGAISMARSSIRRN